jgi:methionyl-tRNA formyltransferase
VQAYAPDFIVSMNFDQILQPPLIALARIAAVNVHPGPLPALRGPCPELWAVARKLGVSGATIHVIED